MAITVTVTTASKHVCVLDQGQPSGITGTTINFVNGTGARAFLFIPHDQLVDNQNHFHKELPINGTPVPVVITTAVTGQYRFGIFCHATNSFAQGSDPEIIVQ